VTRHGLLGAIIKEFMIKADSPKTPLYQAALCTRSLRLRQLHFVGYACGLYQPTT